MRIRRAVTAPTPQPTAVSRRSWSCFARQRWALYNVGPMSAVSESIAQSMNVPEELVMRSARARAEASGSNVDDVLAAWSGGSSVATPAASVAPVEAPVVAAAAEPVASEPVAELPEAMATAVAEPAAVTVMVVDDEDPIEAVDLRDRLSSAAKVGAGIGLVFGIFAAVMSTRFALGRIVPQFDESALRASSLSEPADVLLYITALTTILGALVARAAATIPAWFDHAFSVRSSARGLTIVGAAVGAVAGLIGSGLLMATGETIVPVIPDDPTMVALSPVATSVGLVVLMLAVGVLAAAAVQMMALPVGLTTAEQEESDVIKHRLATSYLMPLMVVMAIASFVVPFAWLLLTFHAAAPIIALVAAAGIITFAGLAASKPEATITKGEFVVAALGIGVILLFVAPRHQRGEQRRAL